MKNKLIKVGIVGISLFTVAMFFGVGAVTVPTAMAASSYSISGSYTITGLTVNLSGTATGNPYTGQSSDQHMGVDWTGACNASSSTQFNFSSIVFTGGSGGPDGHNNGTFTNATWSTSHPFSTPGTYAICVKVYHANFNGAEGSAASTFSANITIPIQPISISPASLPNATSGTAYSQTITVSGTNGHPFAWNLSSGTLPAGLTLDTSATGSTTTISGTPTTAGTYNFTVGVSDTATSTSRAYTLFVNSAPVITYSLTATTTGNGIGNITDGWLNCGNGHNRCEVFYQPNTTTTLTATAATGSTFIGWGGDCSSAGSSPTCDLTMTSNLSVSAEFVLTHTINATSSANGSISPSGTVIVNDGSDQTFTFTPNGGYHIDTLTVDSSSVATSTSYTFTGVITDHTIAVTFAANPITHTTNTLTVTKSGTGTGTVSDGWLINCGTTCSVFYSTGSVTTLTASPDASSTFTGWSGDACAGSTSTTCDVTLNSDMTVNAEFTLVPPVHTTHTLTVTKSGTGTGTVTDGWLINCGTGCGPVFYPTNSTTTLTAVADAGSVFVSWSGGACAGSTSTTCDVIMNSDTTVNAQFDLSGGGGGGGGGGTPDADVSIDKTVDSTSTTEGGTLTYTLTVSALGPSTSTAVEATDVLPAGLTFVSATPSVGSYSTSTGVWTIGDMSAGSSSTLTIAATVNVGQGGNTITNSATVTESSGVNDPNSGNNSSTAPGTSVQTSGGGSGGTVADLKVEKTVDNFNPAAGDTIHYTITATALGPATSTYIVIHDLLPSGITLSSATSSQGSIVNGGTLDWNVGDLSPGTSATMTLTVVVGSNTSGQTITNTATGSELGSLTDDSSNNSPSISFTVQNSNTNTGGGGGGGGGGTVGVGGGGNPGGGGGLVGGGGGGGAVLGASTTGEVLGASTSCGYTIGSYMKYGAKNNVDDVKVLQAFLNQELGINLPITGFFGKQTREAVKQFQLKYATDILVPWVAYGLPNAQTPTGYVYKTTKRWVNLLGCSTLDIPMPQLP
ncbi:MAG: DUF11 domain-containing protein [Patescibacteria group bacterium]|nr:DUF11 domain-containing protein [Patescibacteria group bacterium]MDE2015513.1 DUF11 domain-containing protein [Patescibacteria group bacterium]MDE2226871.1 DUF11 domain-containing protein [Patescibacteria group bacterium]